MTATFIKNEVTEMHKQGKSKEEIRKYLENTSGKLGVGLAELGLGILTSGATMTAGKIVAAICGLDDNIKGNRAKF